MIARTLARLHTRSHAPTWYPDGGEDAADWLTCRGVMRVTACACVCPNIWKCVVTNNILVKNRMNTGNDAPWQLHTTPIITWKGTPTTFMN